MTVVEGFDVIFQREKDQNLMWIKQWNEKVFALKEDTVYKQRRQIAWKNMLIDRPGTFDKVETEKTIAQDKVDVKKNTLLKKQLLANIAKSVNRVAQLDKSLAEYFKGIAILAQARKEELEELTKKKDGDNNRLSQ